MKEASRAGLRVQGYRDGLICFRDFRAESNGQRAEFNTMQDEGCFGFTGHKG